MACHHHLAKCSNKYWACYKMLDDSDVTYTISANTSGCSDPDGCFAPGFNDNGDSVAGINVNPNSPHGVCFTFAHEMAHACAYESGKDWQSQTAADRFASSVLKDLLECEPPHPGDLPPPLEPRN